MAGQVPDSFPSLCEPALSQTAFLAAGQASTSAEAGIPAMTSSETSPPQARTFHHKFFLNRGPSGKLRVDLLQTGFSNSESKWGPPRWGMNHSQKQSGLEQVFKMLGDCKRATMFFSCTPVNIFLQQISRTKKQNNSYFHPFPFKRTYPTNKKEIVKSDLAKMKREHLILLY